MSATTEIAPPEPDLTPDEMLERVRALVPTLRERQAETEAAGRILDETQAALVDAGLYRAMQPRRFGGYEFSLGDFVRVMTEVSRGCPSTGWSVTLTAGHPHLLSHWGEQAQAEIYGQDGDARVPGRPVQFGTAIPTNGGYTVTGTWDYASGCDHATHFMGSAAVPNEAGPPRLTWLLIDRADFTIVDNWDVIGLRGTGSKRVVGEDLFVPEHRVITGVGTAAEKAPGWRSHPNPLFAGGLFSFLFFEFGAIAVGTARGAIDVYEEILQTKPIDVPPFVLRGQLEEYRHHLGEAIGRVDVAELFVDQPQVVDELFARRILLQRQVELGDRLAIFAGLVQLAGLVVQLLGLVDAPLLVGGLLRGARPGRLRAARLCHGVRGGQQQQEPRGGAEPQRRRRGRPGQGQPSQPRAEPAGGPGDRRLVRHAHTIP